MSSARFTTSPFGARLPTDGCWLLWKTTARALSAPSTALHRNRDVNRDLGAYC
jgi:hypothetical protein